VPALFVRQIYGSKAFVELAGGVPLQHIKFKTWAFKLYGTGGNLQKDPLTGSALSVRWANVDVLHEKVATLPSGVGLVANGVANGLARKVGIFCIINISSFYLK